MLLAFSDNRPIAGGFAKEPRQIVDADKRYFQQNPEARSYLRPMRENEFGERSPSMPANIPPSAQFYVLCEALARTSSGWPMRVYRRIVLLVREPYAQTCEALRSPICGDPADPSSSHQADARQARERPAPTPARADAEPSDSRDNPGGDQTSPVRKRPRGGRPRGAVTERRSGKMTRPLKVAVADLRSLLDDYGYDCRIRPDVLELTVSAAAPVSAWASRAAERLQAEFRCCAPLRACVLRWAQQQPQQQQAESVT